MTNRAARTALRALAATALVAALALAAEEERGSDVEIAADSGFAWIDGNDDVPAEVTRDSVKKGLPRAGHPIDLIRSIDEPRWYASPAEAARDLGIVEDDRVLALEVGDDARAYPTRVLDRHEIVNDTIGGKHVAVVW